ncbi:TfoX/Sxy family DNA transformation protein [Atlantibacter subterranea]|uniref:TfoX/Sxy family DNA transformation protein n=2 Tax=Atlantibacter subterraneus TaxID=255519 RepID=A0A427V6G7_9ENTR|nr:TfoX/Sxy family DNA transformation protein [Atlantibacter subterranea]QFH70841.1 TfoX/Sxy family DNA transformation protein [Enterobacter sp. E76]MDA3133076.1 TfoX/Sxy family DNA transformation protein [Atlantibacter subterranea]MDW2741983.1 TfoX/Sxy family DNA transformation protein [Atlantibacter subterranea]RSB65389.1 TfoX/Sxy family DNA transformation protein [Atlantibacter subterranea]RSE08556.1 TfoX/Sxy family DNA transformation protein [Atlantibacter subterranea]
MKTITSETLARVEDLLKALGEVRYRSLFGGYSLTIDKAAFGMLVEGELFLRANEQSAAYFTQRNSSKLKFTRRGRAVYLNYYQVDSELWNDPDLLVQLASHSITCANEIIAHRHQDVRVKDLPNLSLQYEIWLWEVGISDVHTLKAYGAKECWLRLRTIKKNCGVKALYALEGAIIGLHEAALPAETRRELYEWFTRQPSLVSE